MSHKTELLTILHEAMEMRIKALSEQAHLQPSFVENINATITLVESVKDEAIRKIILEYETLKNEYIALLMPYLYEAGAKDSLMLYGLLLNVMHSK